MQPVRLLLVAMACAAALPAVAQTVRVKSGEHEDFSRLVLYFPERPEYEVVETDGGYELRADGAYSYDVDGVFRLIPRDRIAGLGMVGGALRARPCLRLQRRGRGLHAADRRARRQGRARAAGPVARQTGALGDRAAHADLRCRMPTTRRLPGRPCPRQRFRCRASCHRRRRRSFRGAWHDLPGPEPLRPGDRGIPVGRIARICRSDRRRI